MKSPIRLERTIALQEWRITGTLAIATRREWEPAVLKLAEEHEWLTPEIVVQHLLGGRQGIARRLLDICSGLKLLHEVKGYGWRATEAGRLAATRSLVLLPERGLWTVWTSEDPLLPHPIVAVAPWKDEPSAYEERQRQRQDPRSFKALPAALTSTLDKILDVPGGPLRAIRFDDLGKSPRGELVETRAKARITWTLGPSSARCRLKGQVEHESIDADLPPPERTHEQVWQSLLRHAGLESQWDSGRRALRVSFKESTDAERSTMARALRIQAPQIGALGRFDDTTVDPVPLHARTPEDATTWAQWRLFRALTPYPTEIHVQEAYRQAAEPFEGMAGPCPSRAELTRLARGDGRPPPWFWWLQAPTDWSFESGSVK